MNEFHTIQYTSASRLKSTVALVGGAVCPTTHATFGQEMIVYSFSLPGHLLPHHSCRAQFAFLVHAVVGSLGYFLIRDKLPVDDNQKAPSPSSSVTVTNFLFKSAYPPPCQGTPYCTLESLPVPSVLDLALTSSRLYSVSFAPLSLHAIITQNNIGIFCYSRASRWMNKMGVTSSLVQERWTSEGIPIGFRTIQSLRCDTTVDILAVLPYLPSLGTSRCVLFDGWGSIDGLRDRGANRRRSRVHTGSASARMNSKLRWVMLRAAGLMPQYD